MKRWSKEERLLSLYYKSQVAGQESSSSKDFWKEIGGQLLVVGAGLALIYLTGLYTSKQDNIPFEKGIALIQIIIRQLAS